MMEMQYETNRKIPSRDSFGKRTTAQYNTPLTYHADSPSIFSPSETPTPAFGELGNELRVNLWNNVDDYLEQINELGYDIELISERSACFRQEDDEAAAPAQQILNPSASAPTTITQQQLQISSMRKAKIERAVKGMQGLKSMAVQFREQLMRLRRFVDLTSGALRDQFQQQQEMAIEQLSVASRNMQTFRQSQLQRLQEEWRANEEKLHQQRERERKDWDEKVLEMETEIKWLRKELVKTERQAAELAEQNQSLKQSQLELQGTKSDAEELQSAHEKQAAYVSDLQERISVLQTKTDPEHRVIIEQYYREQFELAKAQLRHIITQELKEEMKIDATWIEKLKKERQHMENQFSEQMQKIEEDNKRLREEYRKLDGRNGQLEVRLLELEIQVKDLSQREALVELKYESLQQESRKMKEELMREIESLAKTVQTQAFTPKTTATVHTASFAPTPILEPQRISSVKPYQSSHVQSIISKLNQKYQLPSPSKRNINYHPAPHQLREQRLEDRRRLLRVGEKLARMHDNLRLELFHND